VVLLKDILLRSVIHRPDGLAVVCCTTGETLTYGELNAAVNQLSNALLGIGVQKGNRLAIAQHNCPEYIVTFFAAAKIGAVLVPLDHRLTPRELTYLLSDSGASVLLVGADLIESVKSVRSILATVEHLICIGNGDRSAPGFKEFYSSYPTTEPEVNVNENDLATLHYTSGTTARPKGVMMTHRNLVAGMKVMLSALPVTSEDATLHTSPFSHIAAEWPLLTHCYAGGTNVVVAKPDIETILRAIRDNRVTTWNTVPTLIQRMLQHPSLMRYDLESIRWIGYGASPMPVEVVKQAIRDIGNVFVQVYGLTETYILTLLPKEGHVIGGSEDALRRIRSCGKALPGCLVRVVDASGQDVGTGETGEIIAAGDSVTSGYWNLPEETAQATRDGWFYTGDLASIDEDGYIYIVDRKKEIIVSGGENVSPREVEEVIYSHPAVFEATVIGVPDEKWGEAVRAVIVRKEGQVVTADDIMMLCKQNLAGFKIPKSVEFMDSLPKTASGKIARKELKDRFLG
jgi:acyl-CoA synthetase (AMP-forming)/AMP-acid ligase II